MQCNNSSGLFPIGNSNLYNFYILQKNEILKNKWYLSEKAGKDIGFDHALWDWNKNHRPKWIEIMRESGKYLID